MRATRALRNPNPRWLQLISRTLLMLFCAGLALLLSLTIFLVGIRLFYADRALPGVHAAGIDLDGMTQDEIQLALSQALTYPKSGLVVLHDGEHMWTSRPEHLGVMIDYAAMSREAIAVGRKGNVLQRLQDQIDTWYLGQSIAPLVIFDQVLGSLYLQGIAQSIDLPTIEASLTVSGTEIIMVPGQVGRQVDISANLETLTQPFAKLHDVDLELTIVETPPLVLDATEQAEIAREILREPLTLTAEEAGPWVIEPPELAKMLRFQITEREGSSQYEIQLQAEALFAVLEPLLEGLEREPENSRVYFDDDTGELVLIKSAVIGRSLDIPASIESIRLGLIAGEHEIPLDFQYTQPAVGDDATAASLGISEPVSVVSTYFSGSSSERIHNIKTAASLFHGLLIPPGETLSMAEIMGDVSLDNGYAEALIIFGDRTIKGVGGGVCQVSTTLFRAAFFGGYPIVERYPHAYRVGYYEIGRTSPGPGLDATVFVPMVDFKFTNDTPYWLLLETYIYSNNQLQWKFYSTADGREVEWSRTILSEKEAPKPLYRENPDLDKGEIKQIDWEADGMDVIVYRTVSRGDETLYEDTIKTHYLPWRAIYEFGPGTDLPDDAEID